MIDSPVKPPEFDWTMMVEPDRPDPLTLFTDLPVGEAGEAWDLDQSPWVRVVFDWWLDPRVEWIYLIQGSQTSKTTTMMGLLLYAARYDGSPAMWVGSDEGEVDAFVVHRLKPFLQSADSTIRSKRKSDWRRSDMKLYGRMLVRFAWATSAAKLRSWPCKYVFGDEIGIWPRTLPEAGNPVDFVKKRTRRYRGRKGLFSTTPSDEDHPAWQAASAAPFGQWWVPCPVCGEFQYLDFQRVRFDHCQKIEDVGHKEHKVHEEENPNSLGALRALRGQSRWDLDRVAVETYYECAACHAYIDDSQKGKMIRRGTLQYVDPDTGQPAEPPLAHSGRTLQVPATYSLFTTWGKLAGIFLDAKSKGPDSLRTFVCDELGQPWRETTGRPEAEVLRRCIDEDRGPGEVPEETLAITCGVDVQIDRLYYVVRAWGPARRSWLIRHGALPRTETRGLAMLDDIIFSDYEGHPVAATFIDSGYDPDFVYAYSLAHPGTHVYPSKGVRTHAVPSLIKTHDKDRHGKPLPRGLKLATVASDHFRGIIYDRMGIPPGAAGEWRLHSGVLADEDYCRQILSQARIRRLKGGQEHTEWKQLGDDHYLDCEIYATAAAWYPVKVHMMRPAPPPKTSPDPEEERERPMRPLPHQSPVRRHY